MARDDKRSQLRDQLIKSVRDLTVEKLGPGPPYTTKRLPTPKKTGRTYLDRVSWR